MCFPEKAGSSTFKSLLVRYSEMFKKQGSSDLYLDVHGAHFLER